MLRHLCSQFRTAALPALLVVITATSASADPVEDFYKGKTIRVIVGFPAGGGYDLYARSIAEIMGGFIPGKPTIIVQNMVGGGSLVAAKYMFEGAPRDGTALGMLSQALALDAGIQGDKAGIDVRQMPYIGRMTTSVELGHGMPGARFSTFEDARRTELVAGAAGTSDPGFLLANALNKFAGAKFKILSGYRGQMETRLAAEKGEVDFISASSLTFIMASKPDWIAQRKIAILYQATLKRHPLLPDVPTVGELGLDEDGKAILRLIASTGDIGRSLNTTPGVPKERLAALRKAFTNMVADPDFKAKMVQRNMMIETAAGEALDEIVRETANTPRRLLDQISALLKQ